MKPTEAHPRKHASRDCHLCGTLRHPAQAKSGRALTKHLADNPLPRQAGSTQ